MFNMDKIRKFIPFPRCSHINVYQKQTSHSKNERKRQHNQTYEKNLTNLAQLVARGVPMPNDETLNLMKNMPWNYRTFINSLKKQPNFILQTLIIDLIQEETLMKDMHSNNDDGSIHITKKKEIKNHTWKTLITLFHQKMMHQVLNHFQTRKLNVLIAKNFNIWLRIVKKKMTTNVTSNNKK